MWEIVGRWKGGSTLGWEKFIRFVRDVRRRRMCRYEKNKTERGDSMDDGVTVNDDKRGAISRNISAFRSFLNDLISSKGSYPEPFKDFTGSIIVI